VAAVTGSGRGSTNQSITMVERAIPSVPHFSLQCLMTPIHLCHSVAFFFFFKRGKKEMEEKKNTVVWAKIVVGVQSSS